MKIKGTDENGNPLLELEEHEIKALTVANGGKEPTEEQIEKYIEKVFTKEVLKSLGVNDE